MINERKPVFRVHRMPTGHVMTCSGFIVVTSGDSGSIVVTVVNDLASYSPLHLVGCPLGDWELGKYGFIG